MELFVGVEKHHGRAQGDVTLIDTDSLWHPLRGATADAPRCS
jgi:hypothetical protein